MRQEHPGEGIQEATPLEKPTLQLWALRQPLSDRTGKPLRILYRTELHRRFPDRTNRPDHLFHLSLRSRCTAMLAGLRTLIQTGHEPDR
jgi:hypothetical protein